ncbi:MAG: hypothetical protein ACRDJT_00120 [Actinomycetota bacterium]
MSLRQHKLAIALLASSALLVGTAAATSSRSATKVNGSKPIPLDAATVIVEINDTDGDAGLQVFLDAEPWNSMTVSGPDGRRIRDLLQIDAQGRLESYGLTELFSESNEPPFDVFPLKKFKKLFPEGRYTFEGTTIEGERLVGRARLSHDFPDGPESMAPADGATVGTRGVVARWGAGNQPRGVDITGYRVIVTREDPLRVFTADLRPSVEAVRIPSSFLERGTEYQLEIQAIEESGNQTSTDTTFQVE